MANEDDDFTEVTPGDSDDFSEVTPEEAAKSPAPGGDAHPTEQGGQWTGYGTPPADYTPGWFDRLTMALGAPPGAQTRVTGNLGAITRLAAKGGTLGLNNKATALVESALGHGSYGENLSAQLQKNQEAAELLGAPAAQAAEMAGAFLPVSKVGELAQVGADVMAPIGERIARYFAAGLTGFTASGVQNYNDNPDMEAGMTKKALEAIPAGLFGAAGAMGMHGLAEGIGGVLNKIYSADYNKNYGDILPGAAADKLNEALKSTGLDDTGVTSVLQGLGPNSRLVDANGTMTALARGIASRTGSNPEAAKTLVEGLAQREAQFHGELMHSIETHAGPNFDAAAQRQDLLDNVKKVDTVNYGAADAAAAPVDVTNTLGVINSLMTKSGADSTAPTGLDKQLLSMKAKLQGDDPKNLSYSTAVGVLGDVQAKLDAADTPSVYKRAWSKIKDALAPSGGTGDIDATNPLYQYAREQSATARSLSDAAEAGRNIFAPKTPVGAPFDADEQAKLLGPMTPAERTMYAGTAIKALYDKFNSGATDPAGTANIFHVGTPEFNKMAQVIGLPKTQAIADAIREGTPGVQAIGNVVSGQKTMLATGNSVRAGFNAGQNAAAKEINPGVEAHPHAETTLEPGAINQLVETEQLKNVIESPGAFTAATAFRFGGALLRAWRANAGSAAQKSTDLAMARALVAHPTSPEVQALGARGDIGERSMAAGAAARRMLTPLGAYLPGLAVGPSAAFEDSEDRDRK